MTDPTVSLGSPTLSLDSIVKHFEPLPDPRHTRNRRHMLVDAITIAVCGVIVGCSGPTSIERWAKAKADWLEEWLALQNGIPSRDCIRRVLSVLKPTSGLKLEAFQTCFQSWMLSLVNENKDIPPTIAIDGKTMRRAHDRSRGLGPLHLVSAWESEQGLSLGQVAAEEKSNEITSIPELLDQIDVKGAIVTIDAMGCQKAIARKIVDAKGDYVLAVKDNQPKLHYAIKELFSDERQDDLLKMGHHQHQTSEKGHDRCDERCYVLAKISNHVTWKNAWPGATAVVMAVRTTKKSDGTTDGDVRYFITSCYLSGERFGQAVRVVCEDHGLCRIDFLLSPPRVHRPHACHAMPQSTPPLDDGG